MNDKELLSRAMKILAQRNVSKHLNTKAKIDARVKLMNKARLAKLRAVRKSAIVPA